MTTVLRPAYDDDHRAFCPECLREQDDPEQPGTDGPPVPIGRHELPLLRLYCDEHDVLLPEDAEQAAARSEAFEQWEVVEVDPERGSIYESPIPPPEYERMIETEELLEDGEQVADRVILLRQNNAGRDCADCGDPALAYLWAGDLDGSTSRFLCASCLGEEPAASP